MPNHDMRRLFLCSAGSSARLLATALALVGCKNSADPDDESAYRGGPSRVICGERWSLDHRTFLCDQRGFPLRELRHFPSLEGVTLENSMMIGDGMSFPGIRDVHLRRARPLDRRILRWFPSTVSVALDQTTIDYSTLADLVHLRDVSLWKVPPPTAEQLAAIPSLDTVNLVHLRCPTAGCAIELARELHALRPAVTIRVDGLELRW